MTVIWNKTQNCVTYEVRKAGNTTRLYTNGVFHSQYNSSRPLTGGIWDLLMLPAFFVPPHNIKRVLVLGVGGGAVLNLIHRHVSPEKMLGIELENIHINIAKNYFGVKSHISNLIRADAVSWLNGYSGKKFDLIIDDLFGENEGEGQRAVQLNSGWFKLLNRNLSRSGILVANFLGGREFKSCAYFNSESIPKLFRSVFKLTLPQYHNVVAVFLKSTSSIDNFKRNIAAHPDREFRSAVNSLPYKVYKVD